MTINEHRSFLPDLLGKTLKPAMALGAALLFTGCSELGYLLSNDKVTDADLQAMKVKPGNLKRA